MSDIRVLVVDDHSVVREGIRSVLATAPGFAVVGEAASADEALLLAAQLRPDVILLDISMPGTSGLHVVERLRHDVPASRILILSVHDRTEYVVESVRAGAHGYLRKDTTPAELRTALQAVHDGHNYFSPQVARHLTAAIRGESAAAGNGPALELLTARERQVLVLVAEGLTNKEAAARLGISTRTVEAHRDSLMRKLGIRTVAGLTKLAIESGFMKE